MKYSVDFIDAFAWHRGETPLSDSRAPGLAVGTYLLGLWLMKRVDWQIPSERLTAWVCAHNLFLSLLSLAMLVGTGIEVAETWHEEGFFAVFCDAQRHHQQGPLVFWYYVFYLSKYYELLDTALLVVKGRPTEFLHVFHHCVTLCMCWVGMDVRQTNQWAALMLNTTVHTFMYYYYYCAARGQRLWWKKHLTQGQIVQFWINILGLFLWFYWDIVTPGGCSGERYAFLMCIVGIGAFQFLFHQFFKKTYGSPKAKPQ